MPEVFRKPTRHDIPPDRTQEARDFYMATRRPQSEEEFQQACQYFVGGKCIATTKDAFVKAWRGRADYLSRQIQKGEARLWKISEKIDKNIRLIESKRRSVAKENVDAVKKARDDNEALKKEREQITIELGDMSKKMMKLTKKADTFCTKCKFFSPGIKAERESLTAKDEAMRIEEEEKDAGRGVQGEDSSAALQGDEEGSAGLSDQACSE